VTKETISVIQTGRCKSCFREQGQLCTKLILKMLLLN